LGRQRCDLYGGRAERGQRSAEDCGRHEDRTQWVCGAGTISLGGFDYHSGNRVDGETRISMPVRDRRDPGLRQARGRVMIQSSADVVDLHGMSTQPAPAASWMAG